LTSSVFPAAGTRQDHHLLQPGGGLQLVEQVIAAHEHAIDRRQRVLRDRGFRRSDPDLVQRLIQ
jgi:hypothetical protein